MNEFLKKSETKSELRHPYYIVAPGYTHKSAGVRVLHLLCRALLARGERAFMISESVNASFSIPLLTQELVDLHFQEGRSPIVIYPEVVFGNPLRAPFVVRYLLNFPGLLKGPRAFPALEYMMTYSDVLYPIDKTDFNLFFPVVDTSIFYPPEQTVQRSGSCYYAGKYTTVHQGVLQSVTDHSTEITFAGSTAMTQTEIASLFRQKEFFYCYENTALALEATLCGCTAVFLPNLHLTDRIAKSEVGDLGLAWGTAPEELKRAQSTVDQAWANYNRQLSILETRISKFIEDTQRRAAAVPYPTKIIFWNPLAPLNVGGWSQRVQRPLLLVYSFLTQMISKAEITELREGWKTGGRNGLKMILRRREARLLSK